MPSGAQAAPPRGRARCASRCRTALRSTGRVVADVAVLAVVAAAGIGMRAAMGADLPGTAQPAEPVLVFGLPLGGRLPAMPRECPLLVDRSRELCWLDKAFYGRTGARLGHVYLPHPEARPSWAAGAGFEAEIDVDGELKRLRARIFGASGKFGIAKSITDSFGPPVEDRLSAPLGHAVWNRAGTHVDMTCSDAEEACLVEFLSPKALAERRGAAMDHRESARGDGRSR